MKFFYLANSRFPTEKAHGIETAKLCEAFSELFNVVLIVPRRKNPISEDAFSYYCIKKRFSLIYLSTLDAIALAWLGQIGFWIEAISFSFFALIYLLFNSEKSDIIFSHDNAPLFIASLIRKNTFYDIHDFPSAKIFFYRLLFKRIKGIVTTNEWKKKQLMNKFCLSEEKILVFPNGVDFNEMGFRISKDEARKKLNLPRDKKILVYTGQLFSWKGVDTLLEATKLLTDEYLICIVGGGKKEIKDYQKKYTDNKIVFAGQKKHKKIPFWQRAADVLIIPNTAREEISVFYTSPMKLFEYMAAKRPIVASDLSSIRYIVDESMVYFFKPDDPESLIQAIKKVFADKNLTAQKVINAHKCVKKYSWQARAREIKKFIEKKR